MLRLLFSCGGGGEVLFECPLRPGLNATRPSGRVVISRDMGQGVTTTIGSCSTTDPSGRKT